jgi:hypothetical protein
MKYRIKDEIEEIRERNRNVRFGRWGRLVLLIIGAYLMFLIIESVTTDNVNFVSRFLGIGN